ncbi:helix-turn-helix domain-containing protein [Chromobacterium violaceum]|uniref:helix-turn-helix domain-containing protein n=1 Tax=Chromobacterium violaceum TaxID=536 RepID=UPI00143D140C|nr:helix-turn-helix transcriptional regulator [Chromobacterium violaceum]QIY78348.1 helix-turn-helix transcriptional regulator [Chromobacterium violaceum]
MPFPAAALVQQFLAEADGGDMLTVLDLIAKIAKQDVPWHLRADLAEDLRALLARAELRDQSTARHLGQLSDREASVVLLIAGGLSHKSISRKLGITPRTVRANVENSLEKLGVKRIGTDGKTDSRLLVAHIFLPDLMQRIGD